MEKTQPLNVKKLIKSLTVQEPLLLKKVDNLGLEDVDSVLLLEEVVKFLTLISKYKTVLTPSYTLDMAWHEFILFTKRYAAFCEEHFGRFIHHTPDDDSAKNSNNFQKTIQLYIRTYGEPPIAIWGDHAHNEWQDSQCGACEGTN